MSTMSIIAIGNPGAGKSTILNALAGEVIFTSGLAFGGGLTYQLDEKENEHGKFIDTPGLADDNLREAAGKAISTVLKRGGPYKILFFVLEMNGRVVQQDVATMQLVLDSAPEIEKNYGIIINQVSKNVMKGLEEKENALAFLMRVFAGIQDCSRTSNVFCIRRMKKLAGKQNQFIDLATIETGDFQNFVYCHVPVIDLTPNRAYDIKVAEFGDTVQAMERLHEELEKDREKYRVEKEKLLLQLEAAEQEKLLLKDRMLAALSLQEMQITTVPEWVVGDVGSLERSQRVYQAELQKESPRRRTVCSIQ